MTSTREDMRRELRDLAKLASVIPKDHQQGAPASIPSSSRVTVPPAIATVPPPPRRPAAVAPLPFPRPPPKVKRPAPVAASSPVAFPSTHPPSEARAVWRGNVTWYVGAGVAAVALLVAVAGSVLAPGKTASASRSMETAAGTAAALQTATPAIVQAPPPSPAPTTAPAETHWAPVTDVPGAAPSLLTMPVVVPTTTANDLPPATALPTVVTITGSCPPPAMVRMTRPVMTHHVAPAPAPRSPFVAGSIGGATKTMVAKSSPPRASGHDSLDDLIRKAAGN